MIDLYHNPSEIDLLSKKLSAEDIQDAAKEIISHYGEQRMRFVNEPSAEVVAEALYNYCIKYGIL